MTHDELLLEVQRLRLLKAEHERQIETLLGMLNAPTPAATQAEPSSPSSHGSTDRL